jgi:hypothetical protein
MNHVVLLKAIALWVVVLVCAVLNGALREKVLFPAVGSFAGLICSGLILSACIFLVSLLGAPWYGRLHSSQWVLLGLFWVALTMLFEFTFGRLVQHQTWQELLQAYTFKGGNIWPVVLLTTGTSPWVAAKVRGVM